MSVDEWVILWIAAMPALVALNHLIRPKRDRCHLGPGERPVTPMDWRVGR